MNTQKQANKVFSTKFGPNVKLTLPKQHGTAKNYFQFFNGNDSQTKFDMLDITKFFGPSSLMIQSITDKDVTEETVQQFLHSSINQSMGPFGRVQYVLKNNIKQRISPPGNILSPQIQFLINRSSSSKNPLTAVNEWYYSIYIKLDPNLAEKLIWPTIGAGASHWFTLAEFKTGGYNGNSSAGDYRLSLSIHKDNDGLFYRCSGDNVANGLGIVPGITEYNNSKPFWRQRTRSGSVKLGVWQKLEVYVKRPVGKDDTATGISWMAITPVNQQQRTVVGHKVGGVQMGIAELPLSRLFIISNYFGGNSPIAIECTDLDIWDTLPFRQSDRYNNNIILDF